LFKLLYLLSISGGCGPVIIMGSVTIIGIVNFHGIVMSYVMVLA
jgi:hypothetical protein